MKKPEVKDEFPLHVHTCSGCFQSMRHYSAGGCAMPDTILCETCRDPQPETPKGRGSRADEHTNKN